MIDRRKADRVAFVLENEHTVQYDDMAKAQIKAWSNLFGDLRKSRTCKQWRELRETKLSI